MGEQLCDIDTVLTLNQSAANNPTFARDRQQAGPAGVRGAGGLLVCGIDSILGSCWAHDELMLIRGAQVGTTAGPKWLIPCKYHARGLEGASVYKLDQKYLGLHYGASTGHMRNRGAHMGCGYIIMHPSDWENGEGGIWEMH